MDSASELVGTDYKRIIAELKGLLKSRGLTYGSLAKSMGLSEVTIKRVFSGQRNQASRVFDICEHLGISYLALASKAYEFRESDFFLVEEQEAFLLANPKYLGVLVTMKRGCTFSQACEKMKWNESESYKASRGLEKQGFLKRSKNDEISLNFNGNIRLSDSGELAAYVNKVQNDVFFSQIKENVKSKKVCYQLFNGSITEQTHTRIVKKINEFGEELRKIALLDQNYSDVNDRHNMRWVFAMGPFEFDWSEV